MSQTDYRELQIPRHKEVRTILTTDCKSVETPNGKKPPMRHARRAHSSFTLNF